MAIADYNHGLLVLRNAIPHCRHPAHHSGAGLGKPTDGGVGNPMQRERLGFSGVSSSLDRVVVADAMRESAVTNAMPQKNCATTQMRRTL